jgi:hypothetical protein
MRRKQLMILLLLQLCIFVKLSAQEVEIEGPKKEIIIKTYVDFLYFNSQYHPRPYDFTKEFFRFWGITAAISFRDKESLVIHEFEPRFWYSTRDNENIKEYEIGLRYERCWYLKNDIFPGVRFRWGPSARIYYYNADVVASSSNGFPLNVHNGGLELSMAAHIEFRITEKLKIELTTSNFNLNFAVDYQYNDNPNLTERQKSQGGFDFDLFDQRIMRLGIGYEL